MLHIAIDARLPDSGQGGVLQVLRVLGISFSDRRIPEFKRTWVVYRGTEWWRHTIPEGDSLLEVDPPFGGLALKAARRLPRLVSFAYPLLRRLQKDQPAFDGELRRIGVDLVHLPFQDGFMTELPFVYNPHDLQHWYFPENFSKSQRRHRETIWRTRAERASVVMAASFSVERDLVEFWKVDKSRIRVVPIPPPDRVAPVAPQSDYGISSGDYCIYPAVFWPHKNHLRLIEAVRILQLRGQYLTLVLTGAPAGIYREVRKAASRLPDPARVIFAGHVNDGDLSWLIANARFVVVPSLFEAMSLTVWDGQRLGVPIACSSVEPFPDQVARTASTFDPFDPNDIASAMESLWTDAQLRADLVSHSSARLTHLTNQNYGLAMYGIYCETSGMPVDPSSEAGADQLRAIVSGTSPNA